MKLSIGTFNHSGASGARLCSLFIAIAIGLFSLIQCNLHDNQIQGSVDQRINLTLESDKNGLGVTFSNVTLGSGDRLVLYAINRWAADNSYSGGVAGEWAFVGDAGEISLAVSASKESAILTANQSTGAGTLNFSLKGVIQSVIQVQLAAAGSGNHMDFLVNNIEVFEGQGQIKGSMGAQLTASHMAAGPAMVTSDEGLTVTIDSASSYGTIINNQNSTTLDVGDSFALSDVKLGYIQYNQNSQLVALNDNGDNATDSLGFTLTDQLGNKMAARSLPIKIHSFCDKSNKAGTTNALAFGQGTRTDPYLICTSEQMNSIGLSPAEWKKHFKLRSNLDLGGITGTNYNVIGNATTKFSGSFDGNHNIINNFNFNDGTRDYAGLFGYVGGYHPIIEKIKLSNVVVVGQDDTGALFGRSDYATLRQNHIVSGSVTGRNRVGGIGGYLSGSRSGQSSATLTVIGLDYVGGIFGLARRSKVEDHFFNGVISAKSYVGGLTGYGGSHLAMKASYAVGTVTGTGFAIGGLVGSTYQSSFDNLFASMDVTGLNAGADVGFVLGSNTANLGVSAYYDNTRSCSPGGGSCNGGGVVADRMTVPSYFENSSNPPMASWNLTDSWSPTITQWPEFNVTELDPNWEDCSLHLLDAPFAGGKGTLANPYVICTPTQLSNMDAILAYERLNYVLASDLDYTSIPAGDPPIEIFRGSLDGQGHSLTNLSLNSGTDTALIALSYSSHLMSLKFVNVSVIGGGNTAVLVGAGINSGSFSGLIRGIAVESGSITGSVRVGGIAGHIQKERIIFCYNRASVTASGGGAGGIAGSTDSGFIEQTYNSGTITGNSEVGGILGDIGVSADVDSNFSVGTVITTNLGADWGGRLLGKIDASIPPTNNFVDSNSTCTSCDNSEGTMVDLGLNPDSLFLSSNAPFTVSSQPIWDFNLVWTENLSPVPDDFPLLRLFTD